MTDTSRSVQMPQAEMAAEQAHVDAAYARLDSMRLAAQAVADGFGDAARGGTHQARLEREAANAITRRRLAALDIGDQPLVFGRVDLEDHDEFHIGRLAVNDEDQNPLVVDWRAPVAEPFYRATPLQPMSVVRRRHFQTRGREIVGLDDEVFDQEAAADAGFTVVGEGALLAALERERTGRMRDIVATIQAEQDEAIRAPLEGLLVVGGGPGTGKTAVALHRAAYLLYTYRKKLSAGVLMIGPSPVFLHYVEQVLPSLGEDEVHLSTINGLKSRVRTPRVESNALRALKGDHRMVRVVAKAVRDRQRVIARDQTFSVDGYLVRIRRRDSARIIDRVRRARGTHNERRRMAVRMLVERCRLRYLDAMTAEFRRGPGYGRGGESAHRPGLAAAIARGEDPPDEWLDSLEARLRRLPEFKAMIEWMWPILSGTELLNDLFGFEALVRSASDGVLTPDEQRMLVRPRDPDVHKVEWSEADLALIDEADALLGPPEAAIPHKRRRRDADAALDAAHRVVDEMGLGGFMRASDLVDRMGLGSNGSGTGEIDLEPRKYAHVLVDEAQDLTPMQWRMLARRCPSGSFTVVGDFGQASVPGCCTTWGQVRSLLPPRGGREVVLSVNYRTPAEIMDLAHGVLAAAAPNIAATRALRRTGEYPEVVAVNDVVPASADHARRFRALPGTTAVIASPSLHSDLVDALVDVGASADPAAALDAPISVLAPGAAKGLEFDHVVVVEPATLVEENRAGLRLLYVTLTRATKDLVVVHRDSLPAALADAVHRTLPRA